jgi:hypothetical protein
MYLSLTFTLLTLICLVSSTWLQLFGWGRQKVVLLAEVETEHARFGK